MICFRRKINFLIIFICTISAVVSPLFVIGINSNTNLNILHNLELSAETISELLPIDEKSEENSNINNYQTNSDLFDDQLLQETLQNTYTQESKVIILFKEGTSKIFREELIGSMFNDFEIIYNYDIIPGLYLKCDTVELINKEEALEEFTLVDKIFKSKSYSLPYYSEELPSSGVLNENLYPNWWVPAVGASDLAYDGTGIKVAVIDTGIYEHPDLTIGSARNFIAGENSTEYEDEIGHGTHVAGIIGSNGGGSDGLYRGIAPGVTLINAKAGDYAGLDEGDIISAIEWCVNESADIISMSFGDINPIAFDPITLALSVATDSGVLCVASAGNDGPFYMSGGSPASGVDVISVGATNLNNNLASFSSWGPSYSYLNYPDVVAPGVNIISTESPESTISDEKRFKGDYFDFADDADYIPLSGTSMSCPMVAGALAILKQAYPSITPETARIALLEGAQKLSFEPENQELRSGFGLINISQSLQFLKLVNSSHSDINDIVLIAPNVLPVAPFDLLNFPGDYQTFNLTVISGKTNTYDLTISDVDDLIISLDKSQLIFTEPGIEFVALNVKIAHDAEPGVRILEFNITSEVDLYDKIEFSITIKYPDYRILLDSFHGLNDWGPLYSFYQMYFYNWMKDLTEMDVAVDYLAEYWTPYYDKLHNNSLLTEEKLAQYDIVVLQTPILPYTPLEINNLKNYFDNGGNILFLGTRYQDMCRNNINSLFTALEIDILINGSFIDESWYGIGASINSQIITELNDSLIFNDVSSFLWNYGSELIVLNDAKAIAEKDGAILAASYDGQPFGKGKFIIFGDLHWASLFYESVGFYNNHRKLTENLINYYFKSDNISLNILLNSPASPNSNINISIYAKDQISGNLINSTVLNDYLNISISNGAFYDKILPYSPSEGLVLNYSYVLNFTSPIPFKINVNLTINSEIYTKVSKYLYINDTEVPKITSLVSNDNIERNGIDTLNVDAFLDATNYSSLYLAIYPYSYYSKKDTINKTFTMINSLPNQYSVSYTLTNSDPSGLAIYFILPQNTNSNYINPNSPRLISLITNNPPQFNEESSTILIDNNELLTLKDTHEGENLTVYKIYQGSVLELSMDVSDSVDYEDPDSSNMRVSVNFFMASISIGNSLIPILPKIYSYSTLLYNVNSKVHTGSFTIPYQMSFSSITGTKSISTISNYNDYNDSVEYIGFILITIFDSDGESEEFVVVFIVEEGLVFDLIFTIIIIGVIIIVGLIIIIYSLTKKRRRSKTLTTPTYYPQQDSSEIVSVDTPIENIHYCPYCGIRLTGLRNFCPSCGKPLNFE